MKDRKERNGYSHRRAAAPQDEVDEEEQQQEQPPSKRARHSSPVENGGDVTQSGELTGERGHSD